MTMFNAGSASPLPGWLAYDGSIDGSAVSPESTAIDFTYTNKRIKVVALSSTTFAIAYAVASTLKLVVGSVSGTTITFGTPVSVFASSNITSFGLAKISSSKLLVGCAQANNNEKVITYTVSGTTLTADAASVTVASSVVAYGMAVGVFSSTRGCVMYHDGTNLVVDGLTIGSGTLSRDSSPVILKNGSASNVTYNNNASPGHHLCPISSTKMIGTYGSNSKQSNQVVITDSGSSLSVGTAIFGHGTTNEAHTGGAYWYKAIPIGSEYYMQGAAEDGFGACITRSTDTLASIYYQSSGTPAIKLGGNAFAAPESVKAETGGVSFPLLEWVRSSVADGTNNDQVRVRGGFLSSSDYTDFCKSKGSSGKLGIKQDATQNIGCGDITLLADKLAIAVYAGASTYPYAKALAIA